MTIVTIIGVMIILTVFHVPGGHREMTYAQTISNNSLIGLEIGAHEHSRKREYADISARATMGFSEATNESYTVMMVCANARHRISDSQVRPFVGAGIGARADGRKRGTADLVVYPEFGLEIPIVKDFSITSFARYTVSTYSELNSSVMIGIGIRYPEQSLGGYRR